MDQSFIINFNVEKTCHENQIQQKKCDGDGLKSYIFFSCVVCAWTFIYNF